MKLSLLKYINNFFSLITNSFTGYYSEYIYHGTSVNAIHGMINDGYMKPFVSDNVETDTPCIWFTDDFDDAIYYANVKRFQLDVKASLNNFEKLAIIRVSSKHQSFTSYTNTEEDSYGNVYLAYNNYVCYDEININDIEILIDDGKWIPLKEWNK